MYVTNYLTNHRVTKASVIALLLMLSACSPHSSQTQSSAASAAPATSASPAAPASSTTADSEERDEAGGNSGTPVSASKAQPSDGSHRGPRVKGIQLGDSLDDVKKEVAGLLPGARCELRAVNATTYPLYCDGAVLAGLEFESARLSSISMTSLLTANVFGTMPLKDFVQNFVSAYGIPRMEPQTGATGREYLAYRDESGWEVDIFADKTFLLKVISTPAQQASKFN